MWRACFSSGRSSVSVSFVLLFLLLVGLGGISWTVAFAQQIDDPSPPTETVKLIFIHHSTGENWLADGYGNLGRTLGENNYFVSDTNYGWGPDSIGDRTDIPNWTEWFAGANTERYMTALFNESGQNSSYTRRLPDPGGENVIVMFKSCFPNSELYGNPNDSPQRQDGELSVSNAKYVYNEILKYFLTRPDKLFVVITAPPVSNPEYANNARAFNNWLVFDWLAENKYPLNNVAVFDFYNVLTSPDNHHWYRNGAVEHVVNKQTNTLAYPSGDDHPNEAGSQKATNEFVPLLNVFYHRWKAGAPAEGAAGIAQPAGEVEQPASEAVEPVAGVLTGGSMIDDFESGVPSGTYGWEAWYDEASNSTVTIAVDNTIKYAGNASLRIDYDIASTGWGGLSLTWESATNLSSAQGVKFALHASKAELPFHFLAFGGSPDNRETYVTWLETSQESVGGWTVYEVPWTDLIRAEWESSDGNAVNPSHILALGVGLNEGSNGSIWIDDVQLIGVPAEEETVVEQPEIEQQPLVQPPAEQPQEGQEESKRPIGNLCSCPAGILIMILALSFWIIRSR